MVIFNQYIAVYLRHGTATTRTQSHVVPRTYGARSVTVAGR